jgi:PAS domain S-box-containing protein
MAFWTTSLMVSSPSMNGESFNNSAEKMFGYQSDDVIGKNVAMLMEHDHASRHDGYLNNYLKTGIGKILGVGAREVMGKRKDGSVFPIDLAVSEMHLQNRHLFIGTIRDITRRIERERVYSEKAILLETALKNMGHSFCIFDADLKLLSFNQRYIDLYKFPPGFIHIGIDLETVVRHHADNGMLGDDPEQIETIVQERLKSARIDGLSKSIENSLPDGTHYMYSRTPMPGGGFIATFTDITERKQAEQKAAESAALSRAAIANMAQAFCVFDADGYLINHNEQFTTLFDLPPDLLHSEITFEDISRFRVERGDYGDGDTEVLTEAAVIRFTNPKLRTREHTQLNGISYVHHREPMPGGGWVQTYTDITERKKMEQALLESEERFRSAFEKSSVGMMVRNSSDRTIITNDAMHKITGYSHDEMESLHLRDILHPDDLAMNERTRQKFLNGETDSIQSTRRIIRKDGTIAWVNNEMSIVRNDDGHFEHLISLLQDITEGKIAEQALQTSEERFRKVFEKSGVGIMIRNQQGRSVVCNDAALKMLGYTQAEMQTIRLRDVTVPEDREKLNDERELLLAGDMDTRQVIKRYIHKSGKFIWLVTDVLAVRDSEGALVDTVNLFQDITASKLAEQESEEKSQLINATFESMIQGVAVFDENHILIAFNPQYCEILGLPADFLRIGMVRREILLKRMELKHFDEQLLEERLNVPDQTTSVERTLPNGRTFTFNRMPRTGGGYIATVTDTTDQRAAERQLQQAQKMEAVGQLTGGDRP